MKKIRAGVCGCLNVVLMRIRNSLLMLLQFCYSARPHQSINSIVQRHIYNLNQELGGRSAYVLFSPTLK